MHMYPCTQLFSPDLYLTHAKHIHAHILTHPYTLNHVYFHGDTQKSSYRTSDIRFDTHKITTKHIKQSEAK